MKIEYSEIPTEGRHPRSKSLDQLKPAEIFDLMLEENKKIPSVLEKVKGEIVKASRSIEEVIRSGGRLFFVGAGTSGRLGVLEAAELPPTFNTLPQLARAVMAGGKKAVFRSQEGAEDNSKDAALRISKFLKAGDLVIGIAASGVTPFVSSALQRARALKVKTVLLTCNPNSPVKNLADILIPLDVGPEILSGSTRLKSGTATKMVLNMLTTIAMVQLGKVYGNRMVDLQPKSKKLRERGIRIVEEVCGVNKIRAKKILQEAHWHVKTAILMQKKDFSYLEAVKRLKQFQGNLRKVLTVIPAKAGIQKRGFVD